MSHSSSSAGCPQACRGGAPGVAACHGSVSPSSSLSLSLSCLHAASLSRSLCALFSAVATSDLLGAYNLELASSAEVAEAADSAAQPQTSHLMSAAEVHAVVKFNLRADECEHVRS